MKPTHLIHPGRIIEAEFMEPYGLTMYRLAKMLGVSESRIHRLIHGEGSITPDLAKRLTALFGMNEQTWMNLQTHYDLSLTTVPAKEIHAVAKHRLELIAA